tara:strand:- start:348 stop:971 length:624 start_codon:yes stop_codon:yes gene_type:complete
MSKTELYSHKNLENTTLFTQLAPHQYKAFNEFALNCFQSGDLSLKEKELIAVCCAHTLKCAYCIDYHVRLAQKAGASDKQISEAAWLGASSAALNTFTALEATSGWLDQHVNYSQTDNHKNKYSSYEVFLRKCREHTSEQKLALLSINAGLMTLGAHRSLINSILTEAKNIDCSDDSIIESCFVAVEMAAGACFGHSGQTASILEES